MKMIVEHEKIKIIIFGLITVATSIVRMKLAIKYRKKERTRKYYILEYFVELAMRLPFLIFGFYFINWVGVALNGLAKNIIEGGMILLGFYCVITEVVVLGNLYKLIIYAEADIETTKMLKGISEKLETLKGKMGITETLEEEKNND